MKIKFIVSLCIAMHLSCGISESVVKDSNLDIIFRDASKNKNLICLIVYKDENIVKEAYFNHTGPNSPHDVRSVTKSVLSTLIGIAVDKNIISSEYIPIRDYLKYYYNEIDSVKSGITVLQSLTMTSGISGNELLHPYQYISWFNSENQIGYTLSIPMISQPGNIFNYNSGPAHLLSAVLTQASGRSVKEFADDHLFRDLDIDIDNRYWQTDKQGVINGAVGLQLTPYDMLKIGQLYLNKGMYKNTRIISEDWIQKATTKQISTNFAIRFGPSYGYLWWVGRENNYDFYFANGFGGQFLVIVPEINLIVIATNKWLNVDINTANQQWNTTLDIIINDIISLY